MSWQILLTGILIFCARIVDVSVGTLRTMVTVQGRTRLAFALGFLEVTLWVTIISAIVEKIHAAPVLAVFYGFGFATGNAAGIALERWLALGQVALRVFCRSEASAVASTLREAGQTVTAFSGVGLEGPVTELFVVCPRKSLRQMIERVRETDPDAFYIVEQARESGRVLPPLCQLPTGWRAVLKRK